MWFINYDALKIAFIYKKVLATDIVLIDIRGDNY